MSTAKTITKRFTLLQDLTHLIFPEKCLSCTSELSRNEKHICSTCTSSLSLTSFHLFDEATEMDKLFWGRTPIHSTYTHLYFEKNKASQNILFSLKYRNNKAIGNYFGQQIGNHLLEMASFSTVDVVVPVPLHPKKEFIRGYNQSRALAEGICSSMGLQLNEAIVKRNKHSSSQTKKSRFDRWDNVQSAFSITSNVTKYKHLLLIDDVVTTGSTLESIAMEIKQLTPDIKISIATLAIA
jgi:ComF family protein